MARHCGLKPADWFARETFPLLIQYCREVEDFSLKGWEAAPNMQQATIRVGRKAKAER